MKYAWKEIIEIVPTEVPVFDENGDPIVDLEGLPTTELIDTEVFGNGSVVGLNRGAQEGEREGNITPQHLTKAMDCNWYKVVDLVFTVKTDEEKEAEDAVTKKDDAYDQKMSDIDQKNRDENAEDFVYANVTDEPYYYVADLESIQAVAIECVGMISTDSIPVPGGVWKTNETLEDGVSPVYVAYTVEEFIEFKSAFYTRSSDNFGVKEMHKNNLGAIYLDPESTSEDIEAYDINTDWN